MKRTIGKLLAFVMLPCIPLHAQQPSQPQPTMYAVLLGTGTPQPDPDRGGPSAAVVIGEKVFVVDAGRGAMQRLVGAGLEGKGLRAVFLTHLHSDHIDGLPDVFHGTWRTRGKNPFVLYGPEGTKKLVRGLMQFYAADIHIRRDMTEKLPAGGATIDLHIVHEGVVYKDENVRVTAFLVDHWPVKPAFGYRFESGGKSVVISGDTYPCDNLVRFAKDADILIHEAYLSQGGASLQGAVASSTGQYDAWFKRYHSTAAEAGQIATRAGAKILVLTHLIGNRQGSNREDSFREEAGEYYHQTILVGRDLMRIDLPGN
jgi:ribonuclease Z